MLGGLNVTSTAAAYGAHLLRAIIYIKMSAFLRQCKSDCVHSPPCPGRGHQYEKRMSRDCLKTAGASLRAARFKVSDSSVNATCSLALMGHRVLTAIRGVNMRSQCVGHEQHSK